MPLKHKRKPSEASLRSLSSAFLIAASKRSPKLAATESEIQATTANSYDGLLLQPKQTSGFLHGMFTDHERDTAKKDEETKVFNSQLLLTNVAQAMPETGDNVVRNLLIAQPFQIVRSGFLQKMEANHA